MISRDAIRHIEFKITKLLRLNDTCKLEHLYGKLHWIRLPADLPLESLEIYADMLKIQGLNVSYCSDDDELDGSTRSIIFNDCIEDVARKFNIHPYHSATEAWHTSMLPRFKVNASDAIISALLNMPYYLHGNHEAGLNSDRQKPHTPHDMPIIFAFHCPNATPLICHSESSAPVSAPKDPIEVAVKQSAPEHLPVTVAALLAQSVIFTSPSRIPATSSIQVEDDFVVLGNSDSATNKIAKPEIRSGCHLM